MDVYSSRAISRTVGIVVAIIVTIVVIAGALAFTLATSTTTSTTSSLQTTSSNPIQSTSTSVTSTSVQSTSSAQSATTNSSGGLPTQLVIDEPNNPDSMDPATSFSSNGVELTMNANMPLIFYAKGSYNTLIPVLATSWNESSNGMTYTFHLRNDVTYTNGDPFNAYVVWYNVYRGLFLNQAVDFVYYLYFNTSGVTVGDVNSFNTATNLPTNSTLLKIMSNSSNAVTVINSTTFQFHLTYPFAPFLSTLTSAPWQFVDPFVVQQHGGVVANTPNAWMTVNGSAISNGPYIVSTFIPNQYSILLANPHYWASNITGNYLLQQPSIQKITINYKTDELTRSLDLENGKVQAAVITFTDIANVLQADSKVNVPKIGPSGSLEILALNTLKAPLNNLLVRRAIIDAINVSQIQSVVYHGFVSPVVGPLPATFPAYNTSIVPPTYNLTEAKALLQQAGFANGQGLPAITFLYSQSDYLSLLAQILVQDLSKIGITVTPQQVSYNAYQQGYSGGNGTNAPDLFYVSWTFYPDFAGYEYLVDSQLGLLGYFTNSTVHNLILQSNTELNQAARAHEISQITFDVQQQAATVWLGQDLNFYEAGGNYGPEAWNNCISGYWYNAAFMSVAFNSLSYTCSPA